MFHHPLDGGLADHDESRPGGLYLREASFDFYGNRIVELNHVIQGGGMEVRFASFGQFNELSPIDVFNGIGGGGEIGAIFQKPENLGGVKTNIRIDEQEMGGVLIFHEEGKQVLA